MTYTFGGITFPVVLFAVLCITMIAIARNCKTAHGFIAASAVSAACFFGMGIYSSKAHIDYVKRLEQEQIAAEKALRQPHLYKKAPNGCEVYRFKVAGERFSYYTVCPNAKTSTETTWKTCTSGKQKSCTEHSEQIQSQ